MVVLKDASIFLLLLTHGCAFYLPKYRSSCLSFRAGRGFGDTSKSNNPSLVKNKKTEITNIKHELNGRSSSFDRAAAKDPGAARALLESYGGDIQRGTAERIGRARAALSPVFRKAMELRSEIIRWEQTAKSMSIVEVHVADSVY